MEYRKAGVHAPAFFSLGRRIIYVFKMLAILFSERHTI